MRSPNSYHWQFILLATFFVISNCKNKHSFNTQDKIQTPNKQKSLEGNVVPPDASQVPCNSIHNKESCIVQLPRCEWDQYALDEEGLDLGEACMPTDERWRSDCIVRNSKPLCECHQIAICAKQPPYKRCEWEDSECFEEPVTPR